MVDLGSSSLGPCRLLQQGPGLDHSLQALHSCLVLPVLCPLHICCLCQPSLPLLGECLSGGALGLRDHDTVFVGPQKVPDMLPASTSRQWFVEITCNIVVEGQTSSGRCLCIRTIFRGSHSFAITSDRCIYNRGICRGSHSSASLIRSRRAAGSPIGPVWGQLDFQGGLRLHQCLQQTLPASESRSRAHVTFVMVASWASALSRRCCAIAACSGESCESPSATLAKSD